MVHYFILVCFLLGLKRFVPMSTDAGVTTVVMNPWLGDILIIVTLTIVIAAAWTTYVFVEEPGRLFGRKLVLSGAKTHPKPAFPK